MPISDNDQKELFSIAYFQAIVATAGYNIATYVYDRDSVDFMIIYQDEPCLGVQLKCTAHDDYQRNLVIPFDLNQKNYNDLCGDTTLPRLLIVMIVPQKKQHWLSQTESALSLHYGAYWHSLRGEKPITQTKKRLYLDRNKRFSTDTLNLIVTQIITTGGIQL